MSNLDNFDNLSPMTTAFIDSDNSIQDLEAIFTSGAVVVTAVEAGPIVPIGTATTPKFDNITPWVGKLINPDNNILDLVQLLTSGAIQVQVIGGGGGGGAPTTASFITQTNELLALPNSVALSNLSTGLLANTTGTGDLTPVTLTGTANQLLVSGGDGSSTPTFSISPTLVLPGTLTLGGVVDTAGYNVGSSTGYLNLAPSISVDVLSPWLGVTGIRRFAEGTNKILFVTGEQQFLPDNTIRMRLTSSGMQLGNTGATISSFSADGTLGANSDSLAPTQKATKTFIISSEAVIKGATYITTNDESAILPNSTSTSGLSNGFATVYSGVLGTQLLTGTANQVNIVGGDASSTAAIFSLSSTLVTPGSLNVGTTFSIGGTGGITSITTNPASASSTALMPASTIQAAISAAITAGTSFRGGWDASGGLYPTTGGSGGAGAVAAGDWWYITVAGTLNTKPVNVGDQIFALVATPGQTDANWLAVGDRVTSVFGRTGAIVATSGDYSFSLISGTASVGQGGTGLTTPGIAGNVLTSDGAGNWTSSVPPSAPVSSVFGRTGVVVATSGDYSFSLISGTAAVSQGGTGLTATGADGNVLTALGGVWVSSTPTSAPVSSVFGRTGAVTAQAADYSFSLISGTAAANQGGTGFTTYTKGDIIHASATNTLAKLLIGTTGQVLTVSGGDAAWSDPIIASVFGRTGIIVATSGDYSFSLISGTAAVGQGGTGLTSPGTSGNVLTSNGTAWVSSALPSAPVTSVFGRTGIITATSGDYSFSLISGTAIETQGGTNQTTYTKGDILHATAANTLSKLGIGTTGQVLTVVSGDVAWSTPAAVPVSSVFGRTGAVTATSGDYSFSLIAGTAVETQGGTNQTTYTKGDLLHATAANTLGKLGIGSTGQFLTISSGDVVWSTATIPATASSAGKILRSDGTNWAASTPTFPNTANTGKLLRGDGTNWVETTAQYPDAAGTTGNVLTSDGTNWISSAATGGGLTFNTVTASTQAMAVNNTYYSTYAGTCVMTLPSTAAVGSLLQVITDSSHLIQIAQNASQLIYCGSQNGTSLVTTTGTGGSITTISPNTVITIICIVADTTWEVLYTNNSFTGV